MYDGAVNVTTALATATPLASSTTTASGFVKTVPWGVFCGVLPATGVIDAGVVVFDKVKVVDDAFPGVSAVTV